MRIWEQDPFGLSVLPDGPYLRWHYMMPAGGWAAQLTFPDGANYHILGSYVRCGQVSQAIMFYREHEGDA
jgi:hypothetical protein